MVTPVTRSKTINSLGLEMKKIAQGNKKYINMQTLKNIADHLYPLMGNHGYIPSKYDRKDLKVNVSLMKPLFKSYLNIRNKPLISKKDIDYDKRAGRIMHDTIMEVLAHEVLYPKSPIRIPPSRRYRSPTPTPTPRSPQKLKKRRKSPKK
jgi:hypothetical protein